MNDDEELAFSFEDEEETENAYKREKHTVTIHGVDTTDGWLSIAPNRWTIRILGPDGRWYLGNIDHVYVEINDTGTITGSNLRLDPNQNDEVDTDE